MAKGFKINGVDFDDLFHAPVSGIDTVTFTGLSPTCTYCKRVSGDNPNAAGYWKYNGIAYDAQPKNVEPWYAVALTGASSRKIVFYNISGSTLYTNSACTSAASTNVKYTNQTFYYKSNTSKPTAQYLYFTGTNGVTNYSQSQLNPYTGYFNTLLNGESGIYGKQTYSVIGVYTTDNYLWYISQSQWRLIQSWYEMVQCQSGIIGFGTL